MTSPKVTPWKDIVASIRPAAAATAAMASSSSSAPIPMRHISIVGGTGLSNRRDFLRNEWRAFRPREKTFILQAIATCTCVKDVENVLSDYANVADYMREDWKFLAACLVAAQDSRVTLEGRFEAVLKFAEDNVHTDPPWYENVFEELFIKTVELDLPEILRELLELAYDPRNDGTRPPLLPQKPPPNSRVLARACAKNEYSLVRPLVDFGYRMKAFQFGSQSAKREAKSSPKNLVQFSVGADCQDRFNDNDDIKNLRVLELSVKSSYILACYMSLVERQKEHLDRGDELCECNYTREGSPFGSRQWIRTRTSEDLYLEDSGDGFHFCPTHLKFEPDVLCSVHIECNDPITRCFLIAKMCQLKARNRADHRVQYSAVASSCRRLATEILDHCVGSSEVRMLLKEESGANKYFKVVKHLIYPQLMLAVEHGHKEFVSHAYCQQVISTDFYGNVNWKSMNLVYQWTYVLTQTLLTPVHVLVYHITRMPRFFYTAHYGSTDALDEKPPPNSSKFRKLLFKMNSATVNMDVPINRFVSHTGWHLWFLCMLVYSAAVEITPQNQYDIAPQHFLILAYSLGMWYMDLTLLFNGGFSLWTSFWRGYYMLCHIELNLGFILKVVALYMHHDHSDRSTILLASQTCYGIGTTSCLCGILYWFQLDGRIGPIIISLSHVFMDVCTMFIVFVVVSQAYTQGLVFIMFGSDDAFNPAQHEFSTYYTTLSQLFWSILNPGKMELALEEYEGPRLFVANLVFATFQIFSVFILLNLLIASMNATINKLEGSKELYWKYSKARLLVDYFDGRYATPMPFNILILLVMTPLWIVFFSIFRFCGSARQCAKEEDLCEGHRAYSTESADRRRKYSALMTSLIERYLRTQRYTARSNEKEAAKAHEVEALKRAVNENREALQEILRKLNEQQKTIQK